MAKIVALFGPRRGVVREIEGRLLIGRAQEADLHLLDEKVSREHCALQVGPEGCQVRDLGSRNGTYLNGAPVRGSAPLRPNDQLVVGDSVLVFEPSFEALRARDGESTLVLTARSAEGARSGAAASGAALEKAGELALRAAMARSFEAAAEVLAEAAQRALEPQALAVLQVSAGPGAKLLFSRPAGAQISVSRAAVELALQERRPVAAREPQSRAEPDERATRVRHADAEVLCAPLFSGGEAEKVFCVLRDRPFSDEELALAGALAAGAGPALRLAGALRTAPLEPALPVAESASMREAMRLCAAAAGVPSTVLLRGETGTGKEELARAIHRLGPRAQGPFVAVNCGAIPAELAESELFGHEKGAFTGAASRREGYFEQADGGTLFLDEVGELSLQLQVKLLRVLQDRSIQRIGGKALLPVDVRVVAATHRDLAAMVKSGAFREDLFWRLNVVPIAIAPLRERHEDTLPLAERFLARLAPSLGRRARGFTPEACDALRRYSWPGNARQLANAIERALVLKEGDGPIGLADLPVEVVAPEPAPSAEAAAAKPAEGRTLGELVRALEREQVVLALRRARGVKSAAAQALGVSRPTLDRKIEEYGIDLFS